MFQGVFPVFLIGKVSVFMGFILFFASGEVLLINKILYLRKIKRYFIMKKANLLKLLIVIYAITIAVFMISCNKEQYKCEHEKKISEDVFCYTNKGRPVNMVKYNEIIKMLKAYDATRKGVLEKSLGFEDTRVNTYPIQQLKEYLGYIENLCIQKNIPLTGINIISAAYPAKNNNSTEAGYQTLIFMPTTTIDGESFVTFDPLKSQKGKPVAFKSILAKKGYNWLYDKSKIKTLQNKEVLKGDEMSSGSNRLQSKPPM